MTHRSTRLRIAIAACLLLSGGCGSGRDPATERLVEDKGRGCSYVLPPRWIAFDSELRSPKGSLLEIRLYDLVDAEARFVANLPDSLIPKLEEWARIYFIVDGTPSRAEATVDGEQATELTYMVRRRPKDPGSKLFYWVVRRDTRLYVLRAAVSEDGGEQDEAAIRSVVASFKFLETAETAQPAP
jgi:hypothetical protein